ncbi:DUF3108 domain-containing protein (plasmid) [Azospirillum oryzae]|uniref:DUF3108 domain-containing protein n=1 Tax=Azospirillum oryzae TaxID=286727 RepID=A0A6N1AQT9_9PROT|nr:DUF3108 domain-containing protein [Azospirillum oryzae]KAA0586985.1 DUF3108 domain-containing protein [Azospirillum oryzae]QKS54151.1 DUF3108 domain-containing protein [Azospirillum oryzae]GLR81989.1 hypothetical protein GCM10007856_46800 [Azospirillum oryzae]
MPQPSPRRLPNPARAALMAAGLSLALLPLATAMASAEPVKATYRVFVGGITALDVEAMLEVTGDRYRIEVSAVTGGTIGRLFSWRTDSLTDGYVRGGDLRPANHHQTSQLRGEPRNVTLTYGPQGDVAASVSPPPEKDDREPVPPALQRGTLDPLSAVLDLLFAVGASQGCDRSLPVFDGRRRYDMVFSEVGRRIVDPSRYSVFAGVAQQCRVTYKPVAGYARSSPAGRFWQRSDPADRPPVDLWLAPVAAGYPPLPVRLETDSDFGSVVVHLTAVTPPAADRQIGAMRPPAR